MLWFSGTTQPKLSSVFSSVSNYRKLFFSFVSLYINYNYNDFQNTKTMWTRFTWKTCLFLLGFISMNLAIFKTWPLTCPTKLYFIFLNQYFDLPWVYDQHSYDSLSNLFEATPPQFSQEKFWMVKNLWVFWFMK